MTQNNEIRWVRLGEYIEPFRRKCGDAEALVSGVDINKQFISTRANMEGIDVSKYYLVPPKHFACNLMHIGRDERLPIAYNATESNLVVTSAYFVFKIKAEKVEEVSGEYLSIYFQLSEVDRLTWFYTDSSVRGNLPESRFLDLEFPLPSPEKQKELVATWKGLRDMKEQNEAMAAPLMQLCQSRLQELKHTYPLTEIGPYIELCDETNAESIPYKMLGINKDKVFMPTAANVSTVDIKKYKVVKSGRFVFSGMQTGRDVCIRISLYDDEEPCLVSPAYTTFTIKEGMNLLPEYFFLYFKRTEMDRLGWFVSDSSVRSNLDWNRFLEIQIPIPSKDEQQAIVNIYKCAAECKRISEEADRLSREICPALMQKAIRG